MIAFLAAVAAQAAPPPPAGKPDEKPKITSIVLLAPADGSQPKSVVPPGPEPAGAHGPRGNLLSIFSADDYPAEAMAKGEEGTVVVRLDVSASGEIRGCTVTESSKSESLDRTTCEVMRTRAKLQPARDAKGRRIADTMVQRVRWLLPTPTAMPFMEVRSRTSLKFDDNGALASCDNVPAVPEQFKKEQCASMLEVAEAWLGKGMVLNRTVVMEHGFLLDPRTSLSSIGSGPGETLIHRSGFALTVAPDGKLTGCERVEGGGSEEDIAQACGKMGEYGFAPFEGSAPRKGISFTAIYFKGQP